MLLQLSTRSVSAFTSQLLLYPSSSTTALQDRSESLFNINIIINIVRRCQRRNNASRRGRRNTHPHITAVRGSVQTWRLVCKRRGIIFQFENLTLRWLYDYGPLDGGTKRTSRMLGGVRSVHESRRCCGVELEYRCESERGE
jgi:hypothetical protein